MKPTFPQWRHVAVAAVTLLASQASQAEVVWYSELTGSFGAVVNSTDALTGGGPLSGTVTSNLGTYVGTDNFYLGFAQSNGSVAWYGANGGGYLAGSVPVASGSAALLGVDDASTNWYVSGGHVVSNNNWTTGAVTSSPAYTAFSGGGALNGAAVATGIGLKTVNGYTDMNNNYLLAVADDGTLDHYYLPTGAYTSFAGYGQWTTFQNGTLSGLTLSALNGSPTGSINGTSYSYLGSSGDVMYFETTTAAAVPEPETYAMMLVGLGVLGAAARRRARARA